MNIPFHQDGESKLHYVANTILGLCQRLLSLFGYAPLLCIEHVGQFYHGGSSPPLAPTSACTSPASVLVLLTLTDLVAVIPLICCHLNSIVQRIVSRSTKQKKILIKYQKHQQQILTKKEKEI